MKGLVLNLTAPFLLVLELSLVFPEIQPIYRFISVFSVCVAVEVMFNKRIGSDGIVVNVFSTAAGEALLFALGGNLL